ncbi:MAG TPA: bifunctional nuclease domain-containing protein [Thermodesulfobacteriota bacterium]|nr:bifunctional nuclease domain-containing protein [Thermodesulfobacteriota bacterium]
MQREKKWSILMMAGICLMASAGLSSMAWADQFTPVAGGGPQDLLQVKVQRLIMDPGSMQPIIFLADPQEERALLVWIGPCEATALNSEMEGTKAPRPLTHDLAGRIIEKLKGKIQRILITQMKDGIYYATLVIEREGLVVEIDARPSDCIVLALKSKSPIFVSKSLFAEASVPLKEEKGEEEPYGLTIQELTSSLAQSFSFKSSKGVLVADVRGGSPAEKDGLQRGDIFVEAGGDPVSGVKSLRNALAKSKAPLKVKVFRKGDFLSLTLNPK